MPKATGTHRSLRGSLLALAAWLGLLGPQAPAQVAPSLVFLGASRQVAPAAGFDLMSGMAMDGNGHVYVANDQQVVRVDLGTGRQTTVYSGPNLINSLAVDGKGYLYIQDFAPGPQTVLKVAPGGTDPITMASLDFDPGGIAVDFNGDLFICRSRTGTVEMVTASNPGQNFPVVQGLGRSRFIAVNLSGTKIYCSDGFSVKMAVPGGDPKTIADFSSSGFSIWGLAAEESGTLYLVADAWLLRMTPDGSGGYSQARLVNFENSSWVATDGAGNVCYSNDLDSGASQVFEIQTKSVDFGQVGFLRTGSLSFNFSLPTGGEPTVPDFNPIFWDHQGNNLSGFTYETGTLQPGQPVGGSLPVDFLSTDQGPVSGFLRLVADDQSLLAEVPIAATGVASLGLTVDHPELTIPAGRSASIALNLTAQGALAGAGPTLTASGLPAGVQVAFSVNPAASLPATITATFSRASGIALNPPSGQEGSGALLACGLLAAPLARRRKRHAGTLAGLVLLLVIGLAACSSSSGPATPASVTGPFQVTLTASAPGAADASVVLNLTLP